MNKKQKKKENKTSLVIDQDKQKRRINVPDLDIEDRLKYERLKILFERCGFGDYFNKFWVDFVKPKIKDMDDEMEGFWDGGHD